MDKKKKLAAIRGILNGDWALISQLSRPLVEFILLTEIDGKYRDRDGNEYDEAAKDRLIAAVNGRADIIWTEVKTY